MTGADAATAAVTTTADGDDEDSSSFTLPPSPTGRGECSVHGDHCSSFSPLILLYLCHIDSFTGHCDIPATAASTLDTSTVVLATTTDVDHDHSSSFTGTLPPSPTGRGECSVHVDHCQSF